jgi:hypothetical protein
MKNKVKKLNSLGFSAVEILIAVVIVGAVAGVGYYVVSKSSAQSPKASTSSPTATTTSSIKLDQTDPYLGSMVTFTVSHPKIKGGITSRIDLKCYQDIDGDGKLTYQENGATTVSKDLVYGETASTDQKAQTDLTGQAGLTLGGGSSIWKTNGGAATCKADLFYYNKDSSVYNYLATTGTWQAGAAR